MIGARVDRLDPAHKWLPQVASVIDRVVPRDLLQEAGGVSDDELSSGLAALQGGEFLFEIQSFPTQDYLLEHALGAGPRSTGACARLGRGGGEYGPRRRQLFDEGATVRKGMRNLVSMSLWVHVVEVAVTHAAGDHERALSVN